MDLACHLRRGIDLLRLLCENPFRHTHCLQRFPMIVTSDFSGQHTAIRHNVCRCSTLNRSDIKRRLFIHMPHAEAADRIGRCKNRMDPVFRFKSGVRRFSSYLSSHGNDRRRTSRSVTNCPGQIKHIRLFCGYFRIVKNIRAFDI